MAYKGNQVTHSFISASAMGAHLPVFQQVASSRYEVVVPVGSLNQDLLGFTIATVASAGNETAVAIDGIVKAIAGASLGAGARLAVGSTNGRLIPQAPSGVLASGPGIPAPVRFVAGRALHAAADGDIFSVLLDPEQIV